MAFHRLKSFSAYFSALTDLVGPLVQALPVVGNFVAIWSQAIETIGVDVEHINAEKVRRNQLVKDLTGRELYLTPATEGEVLARKTLEARRKLEQIEGEILERRHLLDWARAHKVNEVWLRHRYPHLFP